MAMHWWLLAAAVTALLGIQLIIARRLKRRAFDFLAQFKFIEELGAYRESLSRSYWPGPRAPHAVLLIHGYSASPAAFATLLAELEHRQIPYLAPALTGFGLADFHLLDAARATDWRRDVHIAYDTLAAAAAEVSVVGISFGTLLAAELASKKPVRNLILIAPYFYLKGVADRRLATYMNRAWLRALAPTLMPYIAKPIRPGRTQAVDIVDPERARTFFQYLTIPLRSLIEVWRFPRITDFTALQCDRLVVAHGQQEQTADVPTLLATLHAQGVHAEELAFAHSGHNLLSDLDGEAAARAIAERLTTPGPPTLGVIPPQ